MEASRNHQSDDAQRPTSRRRRRSRYHRECPAGSLPNGSQTLMLTPQKLRVLWVLSQCSLLSLPQLALLLSPAEDGRSTSAREKSARRQVRPLLDSGLVEVIAVPRAALLDPGEVATTPSLLLGGSAPNYYRVTRDGLDALVAAGHLTRTAFLDAVHRTRSTSWVLLRHETLVRDVRVWLERLAARYGMPQHVERWEEGSAATVPLGRSEPPKRVNPDAWFVYRLSERAVLVALLEVDRNTERGEQRWKEKLAAYRMLFSGSRVKEVTGYARARVIVTTPNAARRDRLADLIGRLSPTPELASRFWLAEHAVLDTPDLSLPVWRRPGRTERLEPLIDAFLLGAADAGLAPREASSPEGGADAQRR